MVLILPEGLSVEQYVSSMLMEVMEEGSWVFLQREYSQAGLHSKFLLALLASYRQSPEEYSAAPQSTGRWPSYSQNGCCQLLVLMSQIVMKLWPQTGITFKIKKDSEKHAEIFPYYHYFSILHLLERSFLKSQNPCKQKVMWISRLKSGEGKQMLLSFLSSATVVEEASQESLPVVLPNTSTHTPQPT